MLAKRIYKFRPMLHYSKTAQVLQHITFSLIFLCFNNAEAQNTLQSDKSLRPTGYETKNRSEQIPTVEAPQPDWQKTAEEDKGDIGTFRYAVPTNVNYTTLNSGKWRTIPDGKNVWQLSLTSSSAVGLAFTLESLNLKEDESIFVYDPTMQTLLGAFTSKDITASRKLFIGFVKGSEAIIEFSTSKKINPDASPFTISTVWHAYGPRALSALSFGSSKSCEININCPQGADWQVQKHGVVMIRVVTTQGVGTCSGALVNNTKRDATPYVLSAYHCSDGYTPEYDLWGFFFNFESPTCANPTTSPVSGLITGCTLRSGGRDNDFLLLELSSKIASSALPYFCGWTRDTTVLPQKATLIHHPQGDIKKITRGTQPAQIIYISTNWANNVVTPPQSHITCPMSEGILEPGSSGSPIFDENKRIFSQLHGANLDPNDTCKAVDAIGGRFARAWFAGSTPATRLKDWLDPLNLNPSVFDGEDNTSLSNPKVSGHITSSGGTPMQNVKVWINSDTATTDANGVFSFKSVPLATDVSVRFDKTDVADNGVDAADLLLLRRHIIGIAPFTDPVQLFAADVDNSLDADAADLLLMRRLIIGISSDFPIAPWRFIPVSFKTNSAFPANLTVPSIYSFNFTGSTTAFDFIGVKTGDVDYSADVNH